MMLKILISPVPEEYQYDIQHIIRLFVDEVEITFLSGENPDSSESWEKEETLIPRDLWEISFTFIRDEKEVHVEAMLQDHTGKQAKGEAIRLLQDEKRAVGFALLEALTSYTGRVQPWGILIGVRPIKLYHKMRQLGIAEEAVRAKLTNEYGLLPHKVELMERIARVQLQVLPDLYHLKEEVSLYIGIPFCPTKCAYCTFPAYALQGKQGSVDGFLIGLLEEIRVMGDWLHRKGLHVTTIYIGGGTPTSLSATELHLLLETLFASIPSRESLREFTVEAGRPDTITPEKLEVMKHWQVDRISINPQSFTDSTLKAIGRHHSMEETLKAYQLARSFGMDNINMDLIIGLPGEGMKEYEKSLSHIETLMPDSLTVHTLSFKSASAMTKNRHSYQVASPEEVERMIRYTERWTAAHGYRPYYLYRQKNILGNQENVGYSLPGKESLYNIIMMEEKQTIIGLGCGASSKILSPVSGKVTRFANPKEPKLYQALYREYLERKLCLLEEVYGEEALEAAMDYAEEEGA